MQSTGHHVRFEADERPPLPLTVGLGLQYTVVVLAAVVLTPVILISTSSVRRQQYHGTEIVTIRVEARLPG